MAFNLKNRHFLTLRDYSPREITFLLKLAADLKTAKYTGTEVPKAARQGHRLDLSRRTAPAPV